MKKFTPMLMLVLTSVWLQAQDHGPGLEDKIEGMLIGSAIGDAAGGPVEFVSPSLRSQWTNSGELITQEAKEGLAELFQLKAYPKEAEPFAQWEAYGPAGTITDDTRFKIIFFNTLKNHPGELSMETFARSVLDFRNELPEKYRDNFDEWIPEIEYATRWALGERENAYPVERIWGGIPIMEGQMPFLPIAALHPEDPEWCYLKTYELGYFDVGVADYHPLASMQIIMEFGHGADSYAQVLGAILGAIHGTDVFPEEMRNTVNHQMKEQFGQDVHTWMNLLQNL